MNKIDKPMIWLRYLLFCFLLISFSIFSAGSPAFSQSAGPEINSEHGPLNLSIIASESESFIVNDEIQEVTGIIHGIPSIKERNFKEATGLNDKPAFVIVHGAWGGSWAFREVESLLREQGYNVYRPSLTGQGERVHLASPDIGLETHIKDVVNVFLFEELEDVILVGHSYGGMVVSGVADRVPDRIRTLIYLDAFIPEDGKSLLSLQENQGEGIRQMEQNGFLVPPWVSADQSPPMDVPHPLKTLTDTLHFSDEETVRNIPSVYIHAVEAGQTPEEDNFAVHAQKASEWGWPVKIIESDHNPQWSAPERLAEMLIESIDTALETSTGSSGSRR